MVPCINLLFLLKEKGEEKYLAAFVTSSRPQCVYTPDMCVYAYVMKKIYKYFCGYDMAERYNFSYIY